ncbi:nitrate assimilation regulatory protein nirA [Periconia macrospinosa]|uniref:Nitrate assimilation regulatory protein nirA n=1 Tax=Periconia macrospinosa TaxID=97972 RepID=A0A2V1DGC2_9PLEO|nr:nitrate assimilation regulatory protein nirA [Periconia macrospinosa]
MRGYHRQLLPGPGPAGSNAHQPPPPKRRRTGVACNYCRRKKISCSGEHPTCFRCEKDKIKCEYASASEKKYSEHNDFIEHLLDMPEPDAVEILRKLRTTRNVSNAISSLKGAAHASIRPSDLTTARAILPSTPSTIEFELSMLHKSVFPILVSLNVDSIEKRHSDLQASPPGPSTVNEDNTIEPSLIISPPSPIHGIPSVRNSAISGPIEDRRYCDARLNQLKIDYWTKIPINDEFAASILSYHFETYHAIFGCVDFDLFLSDLVNHKLDYCSPFLLSAIMSFACQSYSAFDPRSSTFTASFIRDAEKLWKAESLSDSPKNLAALCYLAMACTVHGEEQLRFESTTETRAMAKRMALIGVRPTDDLIKEFHQLPADKIKEMSHAAWGIYGALSFLGSYFAEPPISFPPLLPIPGNASAPSGSLNIVWPLHPLPAYMGRTFPTLSALWIIVQGINTMYFPTDDTPVAERVPLSFIELKCQQLLAWADTLCQEMLREQHPTTHVFVFHSHVAIISGLYHCTMLSLLRPLQDTSNDKQLRLGSFSSPDATPGALYSASMNQLKALMVAYCTDPTPRAGNAWFNCIVLEVATDLIKNPVRDAHWHFYFEICFEYWKKAYVKYRAFYAIARAMLSSALNAKVVEYDFVAQKKEELRNAAPYHDAPQGAVSSARLTFELALAGTEEASIDHLATQLDELFLFHELTNLEGEGGDDCN